MDMISNYIWWRAMLAIHFYLGHSSPLIPNRYQKSNFFLTIYCFSHFTSDEWRSWLNEYYPRSLHISRFLLFYLSTYRGSRKVSLYVQRKETHHNACFKQIIIPFLNGLVESMSNTIWICFPAKLLLPFHKHTAITPSSLWQRERSNSIFFEYFIAITT